VTFRDTNLIPVRSPDGRWYWILLARADGTTDRFPGANILGLLLAVLGMIFRRLKYMVTRSTKWLVLVSYESTNRPHVIEEFVMPTREEAVEAGERLRRSIAGGEWPAEETSNDQEPTARRRATASWYPDVAIIAILVVVGVWSLVSPGTFVTDNSPRLPNSIGQAVAMGALALGLAALVAVFAIREHRRNSDV